MMNDASNRSQAGQTAKQTTSSRLIEVPVTAVGRLGDVLQLAIAALLLVIAAVVFYRTCADLAGNSTEFALRITDAINGVLFVVIILELLETVMSHFEGGGFQLQPFLVIGIISAVRHILTVGARLSLLGEGTQDSFQRAQVELGVNAGVVLALALALILVRRSSSSGTD